MTEFSLSFFLWTIKSLLKVNCNGEIFSESSRRFPFMAICPSQTAVHQHTMSPFTPDTNCYYYGEYFMPLSLIFTPRWEWFMGNAPSGTICTGVIVAFCVNRARGWITCGPYRGFFDVSHQRARQTFISVMWRHSPRPHGKTLCQMWKLLCRNERRFWMYSISDVNSSLTVPAAFMNWTRFWGLIRAYIDVFLSVLDVKFGAKVL